MKYKIILAAACLISCSKPGTEISKQNDQPADQVLNAFMDRWNIGAAEICITRGGEQIYNTALGYSNAMRTRPAQTTDLYRIASVSKPVTAIAIMKLTEAGMLSLNDKVFGPNAILDQRYYLDAISDQRIYSITVKQLLEHTSGWDREMPCDGYPHSDPAFYPLHVTTVLGEANPVGDSSLVKFSLLKGLHHEPGSTFAYSNVGYLVLGKVIEKISGMKYEDYVRQAVFDPLNMQSICLGRNRPADRAPNEVEYRAAATTSSCYGDGRIVPWQYGGFNVEAMKAHGGWISSASDLTKLMLAVDGDASFPDILSKASIEEMNAPGEKNRGYAKGWFVNSSGNSWHTGSLDGSASFVCHTKDGYTWAILLNSRGDNSAAFWNELDRLPWECLKTFTPKAKPVIAGVSVK